MEYFKGKKEEEAMAMAMGTLQMGANSRGEAQQKRVDCCLYCIVYMFVWMDGIE